MNCRVCGEELVYLETGPHATVYHVGEVDLTGRILANLSDSQKRKRRIRVEEVCSARATRGISDEMRRLEIPPTARKYQWRVR